MLRVQRPQQAPLAAVLLVTTLCYAHSLSQTAGKPSALRGTTLLTSKNSDAEGFPWRFTGRLWFRPAFCRAPEASELPEGVSPISFFGWTLGGNVALQYDKSPVKDSLQYLEYVTMGSLVTKRGAVGQWGRQLLVSTPEACADNRAIWGVPAQQADITFEEEGDRLLVEVPPQTRDATPGTKQTVKLSGWQRTRSSGSDAVVRGGLPVYWTPNIKALWTPFVLLPALSGAEPLAMRRLRLSASSLRLQWCPQPSADDLGIPIPVGLTLDGLRIEIGDPCIADF